MIGDTVYVRDDYGTKHAGTITGSEKLFGPFRRYTIVIDDSGQELKLFPEQFSAS